MKDIEFAKKQYELMNGEDNRFKHYYKRKSDGVLCAETDNRPIWKDNEDYISIPREQYLKEYYELYVSTDTNEQGE